MVVRALSHRTQEAEAGVALCELQDSQYYIETLDQKNRTIKCAVLMSPDSLVVFPIFYLCVCIYANYMPCVDRCPRKPKDSIDTLELELQKVVSYHRGGGN